MRRRSRAARTRPGRTRKHRLPGGAAIAHGRVDERAQGCGRTGVGRRDGRRGAGEPALERYGEVGLTATDLAALRRVNVRTGRVPA